jgi:hypothetical protein
VDHLIKASIHSSTKLFERVFAGYKDSFYFEEYVSYIKSLPERVKTESNWTADDCYGPKLTKTNN